MAEPAPVRWDWICCEADHGSSSSTGGYTGVTQSGTSQWTTTASPIVLANMDMPCTEENCSAPVVCCEDEECPATDEVNQRDPVALASGLLRSLCPHCQLGSPGDILTPPSCCDPACLTIERKGIGQGGATAIAQPVCEDAACEADMFSCTDAECAALEEYLACCAANALVPDTGQSTSHHQATCAHAHLAPEANKLKSPSAGLNGAGGGAVDTSRHNSLPNPHFDYNSSHERAPLPLARSPPLPGSSGRGALGVLPNPYPSITPPYPGLSSVTAQPVNNVNEDSALHEPRWSTTEVHALLNSLSKPSAPTLEQAAYQPMGVDSTVYGNGWDHDIGPHGSHGGLAEDRWKVASGGGNGDDPRVESDIAATPMHVCHWSNCHLGFHSVEELLEHVGRDHLNKDSGNTVADQAVMPIAQQEYSDYGNGISAEQYFSSVIPTSGIPDQSQHDHLQLATDSSGLMACLWDDCLPVAGTLAAATSNLPHPQGQISSLAPGGFDDPHCAGHGPHAQEVLLDSTQALLRHLWESHLARNGSSGGFPADVLPNPGPPIWDNSIVPLHQSLAGPSSAAGSPTIRAIPPGGTNNDPTVHLCRWAGCSASFSDIIALTDHLSEVHVGSNKSTYDCLWAGCEQCEEKGCNDCDTGLEKCLKGRQFGSRQKSHTGYRPFVCPLCNQSFSEQATLSAHLRRHANEKPFKCDYPGCKKAFAVMASLTIHKRVHEGDRKHKCPYCDKTFVEVSNMTKHLRMHTGERPFSCNLCDKTFPRLDQLKRHLASFHKVKDGSPATSSGSELGSRLDGQ